MLTLKKEQPSVLLQEKNRMDTQGILYDIHRCSYLDLVMSHIRCENKSKEVNSDNNWDMRPRARTFCPLYSLSEAQSRSTYYLGHRWLCSWRWRTGILGNQFAADRKHNRGELQMEAGENDFINLVTDTIKHSEMSFSCDLSTWSGENDQKKDPRIEQFFINI